MQLVPLFDGNKIVGIRFIPDNTDEQSLMRAFATNGSELPNGDIAMSAEVIAVDGRSSYSISVKCTIAVVKNGA